MYEQFDHLNINQLKSRQRLNKWAIMIAIIGASIALAASVYSYNLSGEFPQITAVAAIACLLLTIPVVFQLKKISTRLGDVK